jgi:hypothetical protein
LELGIHCSLLLSDTPESALLAPPKFSRPTCPQTVPACLREKGRRGQKKREGREGRRTKREKDICAPYLKILATIMPHFTATE